MSKTPTQQELDLLTVKEELKRVTRHIDTLQTSVDQMFADRDMLEDIVLRLAELERAVHMNRERHGEVERGIARNIKQVEFAVEAKVDEIKKEVVDNKNVIIVKESLFKRMKRMLKVK